jgi:MtaA/CmuA family methyltransferase
MTSRERVLSLIQGKPVDHLPCMPITMMFAARLSEVNYRDYATQAPVMASAQIRVCEEFGFDYVSVISDPGCEAADIGANIIYFEDQPPAVDENNAFLKDKSTLATLAEIDPANGRRMSNRLEAVRLMCEAGAGRIMVEGWVEGPCAESADLRGINHLMTDFYDDPDFVRDLFEYTHRLGIRFAEASVEAGAGVIGIGDAAASLVGRKIYKELVLPYEKKMVDAIHAAGALVRLHICGRTLQIAEDMASLGCDIIDIDYPNPMDAVREAVGPAQVLLGNIDPVRALRDSTPESVTEAIALCHAQAGRRYIVGAGCEVPRDTPAANLHALTGYAHAHKPEDFLNA